VRSERELFGDLRIWGFGDENEKKINGRNYYFFDP